MTKGWRQESARHSLARKGIKTGKKTKNTPKTKYGQFVEMPPHFSRNDIQWKGKINGEYVEVYYDDKASQLANSNIYAVFSNKGFLSFLSYGYSYYELNDAVEKYKNKPTNYYAELKKGF